MSTFAPSGAETALPHWVPSEARHYLAHTELGCSIRALARNVGCHASTILRQVRRVEALRDDPLIDEALRRLAAGQAKRGSGLSRGKQGVSDMVSDQSIPDSETLTEEATRILRRLCESGAVLAVSTEMEKAVVVRDGPDNAGTRTAVVDRDIAQVMALNGWIQCDAPGRISRYRITSDGRGALNKFMAEAENKARGFAEGQADFDGPSPARKKCRPVCAEPPLLALARRRDKDGSFFLAADLVAVGERLREDFELSQMGPKIAQNWDAFLTGRGPGPMGSGLPSGAQTAAERLQAALVDLGPGLADVALRCCCHLEGIESIEKAMGWSQRSGKVVLRIALQRLKLHYEAHGGLSPMIG